MVKQIRQGDVLLLEKEITPAAKPVRRQRGMKVILAFGEVTGHHHRFESPNVKMFRHDDGGGATARVFIDVTKPSDLIHEEHSKITLPAGRFEQAFQVEYTPKELRRVAD